MKLLIHFLYYNALQMNIFIDIYFRCGFIIEPAIHYHKMRARKWQTYQPYLIISHLAFSCKKNKVCGKWGMSGEKFHRKMGIPFQITSIFPKNYAKISRIAKNELFMSFSPQQR